MSTIGLDEVDDVDGAGGMGPAYYIVIWKKTCDWTSLEEWAPGVSCGKMGKLHYPST